MTSTSLSLSWARLSHKATVVTFNVTVFIVTICSPQRIAIPSQDSSTFPISCFIKSTLYGLGLKLGYRIIDFIALKLCFPPRSSFKRFQYCHVPQPSKIPVYKRRIAMFWIILSHSLWPTVGTWLLTHKLPILVPSQHNDLVKNWSIETDRINLDNCSHCEAESSTLLLKKVPWKVYSTYSPGQSLMLSIA